MIKILLKFLFYLVFVLVLMNCEKKNNSILDWDEGDTSVVVRKPNIYFYPQNAIEIDVGIHFPKGGDVITSIPEYNNSWHVSVDSTGKIDDLYDFLFYEAKVPAKWQKDSGWLVSKDSLTEFFRNNLQETGFIENEIEDFLEYWIPLLVENKYYRIYPQYAEQIEQLIELELSIQPDNFLRLYYVIQGTEKSVSNLKLPNIPNFVRDGFVITEWGGVYQEK